MMFRNILNTFGTRLITLALSFFLLILTTRYLGAYGRGMISLVVTSVGILVLLNGFVGGAAIVYVIPKHKSKSFLRKILGFSFFWGFVVALVGAFVISYLGFVPKNLVIHIFALGAFASVFSALTMAFLGYEKISKYNAASLIQVFLNFFVFGSAIIAVKKVTVNSFLFSLYASYVIGIFFALFFLAKIYKNLKEESN